MSPLRGTLAVCGQWSRTEAIKRRLPQLVHLTRLGRLAGGPRSADCVVHLAPRGAALARMTGCEIVGNGTRFAKLKAAWQALCLRNNGGIFQSHHWINGRCLSIADVAGRQEPVHCFRRLITEPEGAA